MNAGTKAARSTPLSLVAASEAKTPITALPIDVQDLCSLGMNRALGIEENVSLDKAARYQKASRFAPMLGKLFKAATQAIASCMKLQLNWMTLRAHRASAHVGPEVNNSGTQSRPTAEVLERSTDIAIGPQRVPVARSAAARSSDRRAQPQPTSDELAYSMDIAIGERFTVSNSRVVSTSDRQSPPAEVPDSHSAPQWLRGRAAKFNRFQPSYCIVDDVALQAVQEAKPTAERIGAGQRRSSRW